MDAVEVGERSVGLAHFVAVVWEGAPLVIAAAARQSIRTAADFVVEQARSGKPIYGVTTGFGSNKDTIIPPEKAELLQEKLLMSHACGVGEPLPTSVVRGMMFLRVAALVQGRSGIQPETLDLLVTLLNERVHPIVPEHGSVGASGDLCPLAHMALPIIGLGEVEYGGRRMPAAEALDAIGAAPRRLTYKEGLALLNGTQAMTAVGLVVIHRFRRLLDIADLACALSLEGVGGRLEAFDPRIHALRGRPGQEESARAIRDWVAGSELAGASPGTVPGKTEYVQDSYSLRCAPQVHGASREAATYATDVLVSEANAVTDNPIVFPDDGDILSGGNFHGQPVALVMDYLKLAVSELGNISERRSAKLVDKAFNEGLPAFLVSNPGLNSGHMIPQYVAAALVSECKAAAHPASVDSIPTSANLEDHVSMGHHAARGALRMLELVERVIGIELMLAAQAIDLRRPRLPSERVRRVLELIRERVPFLREDRVLSVDIEAMAELVRRDLAVDHIAAGVE